MTSVQGGAGRLPAGAAVVDEFGSAGSLALAAGEESGAFGVVGMGFTLLKELKEANGTDVALHERPGPAPDSSKTVANHRFAGVL